MSRRFAKPPEIKDLPPVWKEEEPENLLQSATQRHYRNEAYMLFVIVGTDMQKIGSDRIKLSK